MKENNIMIDLESMGKNSFAAIISIGAVKFDPDTSVITDLFYENVSLKSSLDLGLKVDAETVEWWLQQDKKAQNILSEKAPLKIAEALNMFSYWIGENPIVWGNGAGFDNVILSNAFELAQIEKPWKYYNDRCYRTMKEEFPEVEYINNGVKHFALDDAKAQANHLMKILNSKKNEKVKIFNDLLYYFEKLLDNLENLESAALTEIKHRTKGQIEFAESSIKVIKQTAKEFKINLEEK